MNVGGMLFPPSYSRDQYTAAEEAEQDARDAYLDSDRFGDLWGEPGLDEYVESLPEARLP